MRTTRISAAPSTLILATSILLVGTGIPLAAQETGADPRLLQSIDLYTGVAGHVDDAEARRLLEAAASNPNDALATMWIARVHSTGRMTFPVDPDHARQVASRVIDRVRDLAADGDVEAAFLMGTAYDESLGVEQDYHEAMRWYRKAAHRGHVLAVHNVGNMYRDGRGIEVDHARAAIWWLRAARAGDVIPALRLGEAYEAGRGVPLDAETARTWYEQAAAVGNATAAEALERIGG